MAVEEIQREIGDPLAVRNAVQTDTWKRIPPPAGRVLRRRYWVREDVDAWPGRRFQLEEAVVRAAAEPRTGPSR